uniref:Uncharacterized protein n=1 Tax=Arundo donax TaxID=35708 RepID=A0A0A9F698_ARUDO
MYQTHERTSNMKSNTEFFIDQAPALR